MNVAQAAASGLHSDPMLTQEEAAIRLRLSAHTLARWRSLGVGPRFVRLGNRRVLYSLSDITAYLNRV
jgi:predicted DNA-binding transcriptional regulator AlpA